MYKVEKRNSLRLKSEAGYFKLNKNQFCSKKNEKNK